MQCRSAVRPVCRGAPGARAPITSPQTGFPEKKTHGSVSFHGCALMPGTCEMHAGVPSGAAMHRGWYFFRAGNPVNELRNRRSSLCRTAGEGGVFFSSFPPGNGGTGVPGQPVVSGEERRLITTPCNAFYALSFMVDPVNICCPLLFPCPAPCTALFRTVSPARFSGTGRVGHEER